LDEKAIQAWWEKHSDPKSGNLWKTLSQNCSTIASDALKAGGGEEVSSWWKAHNGVWTPNDVKKFTDSINKGLDDVKQSRGGATGSW
jgi:hypothetical protein